LRCKWKISYWDYSSGEKQTSIEDVVEEIGAYAARGAARNNWKITTCRRAAGITGISRLPRRWQAYVTFACAWWARARAACARLIAAATKGSEHEQLFLFY
jgi:hypothetical protein